MKKLISLLLLCAVLAGCGASARTEGAITFTDDLGRTVTLEQPRRVACLLGSFAHVWHLSGGQVIAAPDDAWVDFDFPLPGDAVNLGSSKSPSLELLLAAEPDLVIASSNTAGQLQLEDTLQAAGIPVAYFDVSDFEDYLRMLEICTTLTERPDLYQTNGLALQAEIGEIIARAGERGTTPKVLYLRSSATSIRAKSSRDSVLGEMLADLGCVNIADTDAALLEKLSVEHILMQDPDFIFIIPLGDDEAGAEELVGQFFRDNPALEELTAAKEGNVIFLDKRLYNMKPNDRWAEAYRRLEEILREG